MNPEPSAERCEACGHEESEHTLGEKADRRVGMQATGPYCEGGTNCLCMGAIWFEKIRILRAENEEFRKRLMLTRSAPARAAVFQVLYEARRERDAARAELEGERRTLRDVRDDVFRYLKEDPDNFALRAIVMDFPLGWKPTQEARRVLGEGARQ